MTNENYILDINYKYMNIMIKEISEEQLKEYFELYPNIKIYKLYEDMTKEEKENFRKNKIKQL